MAQLSETILAPAKINLYLHVGPPKRNGRHDLDSLVVFTDSGLADILRLSSASHEEDTLAIGGPFGGGLSSSENLVLRACALARELVSEAGRVWQPLHIELEKHIPHGAGLGGGSSDAAAVLRFAIDHYGLDAQEVMARSAQLGGDVPVCVYGKPAHMQGEGEHVLPAPIVHDLPHILLVNPRLPLPTGKVFNAFDMSLDEKIPERPAPVRYARLGRNDLTRPAIQILPIIGEMLAALAAIEGARMTRMSGSGATCFALFQNEESCAKAKIEYLNRFQNHWAQEARLSN